jgi:hypothetical protein
MTEYYVKKVRRNDNGQIVQVKTSKELESRPSKVMKRKKVVKHLKKGKDIKTAYLKDGRWTEGDQLKLHNDKWLRTEGNTEKRDNLGSLRSF